MSSDCLFIWRMDSQLQVSSKDRYVGWGETAATVADPQSPFAAYVLYEPRRPTKSSALSQLDIGVSCGKGVRNLFSIKVPDPFSEKRSIFCDLFTPYAIMLRKPWEGLPFQATTVPTVARIEYDRRLVFFPPMAGRTHG